MSLAKRIITDATAVKRVEVLALPLLPMSKATCILRG